MNVSNRPISHHMTQLTVSKEKIQEAAEQASNEDGVVDTSKVEGPLREVLKNLGGASTFDLDALSQKLDRAMAQLDRADTIGTAPRHAEWRQPNSINKEVQERRDNRIVADLRMNPDCSSDQNKGDYILDGEERSHLLLTPYSAAQAVLKIADTSTDDTSRRLAEEHFWGIQYVQRDDWGFDDPSLPGGIRRETNAVFRCDAGGLKDIASVSVKHHDSGKWLSAPVKEDGSYKLPVGDKEGEFSIWYEKNDGERFMGGRVQMLSETGTENIAEWPSKLASAPETTSPPLAFAPRRLQV